MSRLIIDTHSHNTVMESARPTGRQANTQHSVNLKKALAETNCENKIKSAIRTFYAERGLNLICRMLDYFFTGGERVYARNLLIAMEVLHVMSQLDCKDDDLVNSKTITIKKELYDYLKEIELLPAESTVIDEELKYDTLTATPNQSPFLMGRLLSKLCQLSSFSSEMVKTWQVNAFNVYGDGAQTSELHQSPTKKIITHLPVCGTISLHDESLDFNEHSFEFRSNNIDGNIFCMEFLCAAKLGDTRQSSSDSLTLIHDAAKELRKIQNDYTGIKAEFDKKQNDLADLECEIKTEQMSREINTERMSCENLSQYQELNTPLQELCKINESLAEKINTLRAKYNLLKSHNAIINDKIIDGKMATTIDFGNSGGERLMKLVYFHDNVNAGSENLPSLPWQAPEEIDINRTKYHYEDLIQRASNLEIKQNEYIKSVNEYKMEVNSYCKACNVFENIKKEMNRTDNDMNKILHLRSSLKNMCREVDNESEQLYRQKIDIIERSINQRVAIQDVANDIEPLEQKLTNLGDELLNNQATLKKERINLLCLLSDIPEDTLSDCIKTVNDQQEVVNTLFNSMFKSKLISNEELIKLSKMESNERSVETKNLAQKYYDYIINQENLGIESAIHEQMPVTPTPRSSVQASPLASPRASILGSPLASPTTSVQSSPLASPLASPNPIVSSTSPASSSQSSLTFRRHPN